MSLSDYTIIAWLGIAIGAYLIARYAERRYGFKEAQKHYEQQA